jgi:hypothetical protein
MKQCKGGRQTALLYLCLSVKKLEVAKEVRPILLFCSRVHSSSLTPLTPLTPLTTHTTTGDVVPTPMYSIFLIPILYMKGTEMGY